MNWYLKIKLAQIWQTDVDSDFYLSTFKEDLSDLYELEYKYNMMKSRPFKGVGRRRESMIDRLATELRDRISRIKPVLEKTFSTWLQKHALGDSQSWAQERHITPGYIDMDEYIEESGASMQDVFHSLVHEYKMYQNDNKRWYNSYQGPNWNAAARELLMEIEKNIDNFSVMRNFIEKIGQEYKEMLIEEIREEDIEEINNRYPNQNFQTIDQAINFIENQSLVDLGYGPTEILDMFGDELWNMAYKEGVLEDILIEINKNIVYPLWYQYWSSQGIDDTRKNIEEIYKKLQDASNLGEIIAAINMALNAAHQTGDMVDYIEEYGKTEDYEMDEDMITQQELAELSEKDVEEWNEQLRSVGVEI